MDRVVVEAGAPEPQGFTWVCTGSKLPPSNACEVKSNASGSTTLCCQS